ncbi:MAG: SemiSWEET family sugar transporter [Beijerinckiaceae bacterium]
MTMAQLPEIAGILGAVLTTACWVPQAVQTIRTRDTAGLSLAMYATLLVGLGLWLIYAISIMSWPLIMSNIATGVLALIILVLKIRHG